MQFDNGAAYGAIDTSFFDCRSDVKNDSPPGHPMHSLLGSRLLQDRQVNLLLLGLLLLGRLHGKQKRLRMELMSSLSF